MRLRSFISRVFRLAPGWAVLKVGVLLWVGTGVAHGGGAVFRTNDVVVFLGGSAVVAQDRNGQVETILTLTHPGHRLRFRSLAWEGDTVFGSPRELNFPSLTESLKRCQASVVCAQFGALEALDPGITAEAFRSAYLRRIDAISGAGPRVVMVVPPPFESPPPPLPDLGPANDRLARFADVIRALATERRLEIVDLPRALVSPGPPGPWTYDGREATPAGHRAMAAAWAREVGSGWLAERASTLRFWEADDLAELQRAVGTKNRLWFDYWRPMNWAFLAGDRTEQQASRDHRDRTVRWFPAEMEEYVPLIAEADRRIESLAAQLRLAP